MAVNTNFAWSVALLVAVVGCGPERGDTADSLTSLTALPTFDPPNADNGGDNGDDDDDGGSDSQVTTSGGATEGSATNATNVTSATNVTGDGTEGSSDSGAPVTSTTQVSSDPPQDTGDTFPPETTDDTFPPETTDDSNGFIPDPDPDGECDIWKDNCQPGEKCMPVAVNGNSWDSTACVPIQGNDGPGEACTHEGGTDGLDSCEKHAICLGPEANEGTCVGMCTGSEANPVCPAGQVCAISNDGVLILCVDGCDPLADDCKAGEVCIATDDDFTCAIDASGGEGQVFDTCEYINVCDPGLACVTSSFVSECNQNFVGCCSPYCDLESPACPGALTCVPWYEEGQAPPQHADVGLCVSA